MLPSAVADILAETRVTLGERPQGLSGDKPGRIAVLVQPLRLVRLTFQSQRKRQSLHFLCVQGWSFHSVFKEVETRTSAGQVSQVLLVTFSLGGVGVGGGGGRGKQGPKSLRTQSKKNNKS